MRVEMQRSGGFTGTTIRWSVEAPDDGDWPSLVQRAGLRFGGPLGRIGRFLLFGWPLAGGPAHQDYWYIVWVDGQRAFFRGIDVEGPLAELVNRVIEEGEEIRSR
jgi:hypothetical protein